MIVSFSGDLGSDLNISPPSRLTSPPAISHAAHPGWATTLEGRLVIANMLIDAHRCWYMLMYVCINTCIFRFLDIYWNRILFPYIYTYIHIYIYIYVYNLCDSMIHPLFAFDSSRPLRIRRRESLGSPNVGPDHHGHFGVGGPHGGGHLAPEVLGLSGGSLTVQCCYTIPSLVVLNPTWINITNINEL